MENKHNDEMDAIEFVEYLASTYKKVIEETEGAFIINPPQFTKFRDALEILEVIAKEEDGKINIDINPPDLHGFITLEVSMLDIYGDKINDLKRLVGHANVFSVEPSNRDTIIVGININNLWKRA